MKRRKHSYLLGWLGLVAFLGLISCSVFSPTNELERSPESVPEEATEAYNPLPFHALAVVDQRTIELPEGVYPLSLSPDGQWLLAYKNDAVCIYITRSLKEQACQPWRKTMPITPTWSPDSQRVVFTENSLTSYIESDLWVLSTADGQLINLTEDGFDRKISLGKGMGEQVDYAPAFSPDGNQLIFARTLLDDDPIRTTELYQIAAEGGEAQKLGTLDPEYPLTIYGNLYWPAAPGKIFYSLIRPKASNPQNGIWQIASTGKNPKHIVTRSEDFGPPMVQAVHPEGDQIILAYEYSLFGRLAPPEELIYLFDLTSGATTTFLAPVEFEVSTAKTTFSPDGNTILYLLGGKDQFALVAYEPASSETKVLLEQNGTIPAFQTTQRLHITPFFWAENNLVYIPIDGPAPDLLIQLTSAE